MQVVRVTSDVDDIDLSCECHRCNVNKGDRVYVCNVDNKCIDKYYCAACGPFMHGHGTGKTHSFQIGSKYVLCINDLLQKVPNGTQFEVRAANVPLGGLAM